MHILHIITGLNDAGAEAVLFRLCTHESAERHSVISLTGRGKYGPMLEARGISVCTLGMPHSRVTVAGLWQLWRLIRKARPDAIQTWLYHGNLLGGLVGRLAGQRNIVWGIHHSTLIPSEHSKSTILTAKLCRILSSWVPRHIVFCGNKALAVHAALGYDTYRSSVIENGCDVYVYKPDRVRGNQVRKSLCIGDAVPLIGFVARYTPEKDHETLLKALAELKDKGTCPHCLLVGEGLDSANAVLGERIASRGLEDHVRLLGRRDDIPGVMNALDLHVMSSSSEAFPNVLVEAMACGTPCVSTDVGDATVILGDTGRIVPPRNSVALATALSDMLAERGSTRWKERREAARDHVAKHFSIERMVERYRAVWFREPDEPKTRTGN